VEYFKDNKFQHQSIHEDRPVKARHNDIVNDNNDELTLIRNGTTFVCFYPIFALFLQRQSESRVSLFCAWKLNSSHRRGISPALLSRSCYISMISIDMPSFLFHEATSAKNRRHFPLRITRKKGIPEGEGHIDQASRGGEREREREPQHVAAPLSWSITDQYARGNFREVIMSRSFGRPRSRPQPRSTTRVFASRRGHARGYGRYINRRFRSNGNETATCRRRITCETTASSGILASVAVVLAVS